MSNEKKNQNHISLNDCPCNKDRPGWLVTVVSSSGMENVLTQLYVSKLLVTKLIQREKAMMIYKKKTEIVDVNFTIEVKEQSGDTVQETTQGVLGNVIIDDGLKNPSNFQESGKIKKEI